MLKYSLTASTMHLATRRSIEPKSVTKKKNLLSGLMSGLLVLMIAGIGLPNIASAATPIHAYELNGNLEDTYGGPALISEGGTTGATDYEFGPNQGLTLNTPVLTAPGQYSIELQVSLNSLRGVYNNSWIKLIDFKNLASDTGLYTFDGDASFADAILQFYPIGGTENAFVVGEYTHVVITRDATTKEVAAYALGVGQFTFVDIWDWGVFDAANNIMRFLQDDYPTGTNEAASGIINFIRIYDSVLTAEEVAVLNDEADIDSDDDGIPDDEDNCPEISNENQSDIDGDGIGDACDADIDEDGVANASDNCQFDYNPDQLDTDGDGAGDVCDSDLDGDNVIDADDACLPSAPGAVVNVDGCSIADLCPCENSWKNHGQYVKCVAHAAKDFVKAGLLDKSEMGDEVSNAAMTNCGK